MLNYKSGRIFRTIFSILIMDQMVMFCFTFPQSKNVFYIKRLKSQIYYSGVGGNQYELKESGY